MKKRIILVLLLSLLVPQLAKSLTPGLPERNFDISFEVTDEPKTVGDFISVKWSFKLDYENDSILRTFYEQEDTIQIVKAYLHTAGPLKFISGDTLWWGIVDYNKIYSMSTTFQIDGYDRIAIRPIVETHFELNKNGLLTRNEGEACILDFSKPLQTDRMITVTPGGDTVIVERSFELPPN